MQIANPRKRMRLEGYDYNQEGWYFITICTENKQKFFGKIKGEEIILNYTGKIVKQCWFDLPNHYRNCVLDEFIIMPNHVHGIIIIQNDVGNGFKPFLKEPLPFKQYGLSEIIRGFKTFSARKINAKNPVTNFSWQKSYYDHIIRNERSLNNIRQYIIDNPRNWKKDDMYW